MSVRSAIILGRMALLFFLAESPLAYHLARHYPHHGAAIVLAGALVVAAPMAFLLARAIHGGLEGRVAEKYHKGEGRYLLAAAASLAGMVVTFVDRPHVGIVGVVLSTGGMLAALWLLFNAGPAGSRQDSLSR